MRERGRERERERERERLGLTITWYCCQRQRQVLADSPLDHISAIASKETEDSSTVFSVASFEEPADVPVSAKPEVEPVLGFPGASIVSKSTMPIKDEARLD